MSRAQVTLELVRALFEYDSETGQLKRLVTTNPRAIAGTIVNSGCSGRGQIQIDGVKYETSRVVWLYMTGHWPEFVIDHKDGDPSNNRWLNLRDVKQGRNVENLKKAYPNNKSSGLLGVTLYKPTNRWMASIKVNRVRKHIGYFDTPQEAHQAYLERKRVVHAGCLI